MTYAHIRDRIQTGDVLLCRGRGLLSWAIATAQRSRWSHVGLLIRAPEPQWPDAVLVWESTTLGKLRDVRTGGVVHGVRLVSASDLVTTYPGALAWRRLEGRRTETMERGWIDAYGHWHGQQYERRWWSLARALVDWTPDATRDLSSLFCSELAAATWQAMGLLPDAVNPSEVIPRDWSTDGGDVLARYLPEGYRLHPEVALRE